MVTLCSLSLLSGACAHKAPRIATSPYIKTESHQTIVSEIERTSDLPPVTQQVDKPVEKTENTNQSVTEMSTNTNPRAKITLAPTTIKIPSPKAIRGPYDTPLIFDIPIAYNSRVKHWVEYFQTSGRSWYTRWLERSSRYMPAIQQTLKRHGLPQDLAYMAMIESGFSSHAESTAQAVGPWQFIRETGKRYGLTISWWLDERRDFQKSTDAAAKYLRKMHNMFNNWYLVAAGYNTGENRIRRIVQKRGTKNFWKIAQNEDLMDETRDYVPKLIAAMLIAKSPQMYGFRNIQYNAPLKFDHFRVPGGTRLDTLADAIGVTHRHMEELNPDLIRGYVPPHVEGHLIRIPKGSTPMVSNYIRRRLVSER